MGSQQCEVSVVLLDEGLLDVFPMKSISCFHPGLLQPPSNPSTIAKLPFLKAVFR